MDECIEVLQTHPDALPTDRQALWWAKLAFIMEDASLQLITDDAETVASFSDSKVQYTIRGFSNQLSQWRRDIPEDAYSGGSFTIHLYRTLANVSQIPWPTPTRCSTSLYTKLP